MADVVGGFDPEVEEWLAVGATDLAPAKSLERIDKAVAWVFASVSIIGTILAGLGVIAAAQGVLERERDLAFLTFACAAGALVTAAVAMLPSLRGDVDRSDSEDIKRLYQGLIRRRGRAAKASMALLIIAVAAASVLAIRLAADDAGDVELSLKWVPSSSGDTFDAAADLSRLSAGTEVTVSVEGLMDGTASVLARKDVLVSESGESSVVLSGQELRLFDEYVLRVEGTGEEQSLERRVVPLRAAPGEPELSIRWLSAGTLVGSVNAENWTPGDRVTASIVGLRDSSEFLLASQELDVDRLGNLTVELEVVDPGPHDEYILRAARPNETIFEASVRARSHALLPPTLSLEWIGAPDGVTLTGAVVAPQLPEGSEVTVTIAKDDCDIPLYVYRAIVGELTDLTLHPEVSGLAGLEPTTLSVVVVDGDTTSTWSVRLPGDTG